MKNFRSILFILLAVSPLSCQKEAAPAPEGAAPPAAAGISPQRFADALHAVMESDRVVYTKNVVNRLQNKENIIKASEHWEDEKTLPLPAQMFRMGAEMVAKKEAGFTYSLLSLWPLNKQNKPSTDLEKKGLEFVAANKGANFYGEEELGGQKYFTAVYADVAVAEACVKCHNEHKDAPRTDFQIGDVMGGVVVRIPL
ncbi:MAG: hypothetical protein B6A08_03610 [Sorangiineae bacterium NIC37A_2]|nr:MAG: hypothetical protein B6A08_03610 [Sorangiineae bacterium NIC37A_2]